MSEPTLFIYPEVPREDQDIERVWVNRVGELQTALNLADACIRKSPRLPLAVVGSARIGKSHMLRKIFLAIRKQFSAIVNANLARGPSDNRTLALELLLQFTEQLQSQLDPEVLNSHFSPFFTLLQQYAPLIYGDAQELTISDAETITTSIKLALSGEASVKLTGGGAVDSSLLSTLALLTGMAIPTWAGLLKGNLSGEVAGKLGGVAEGNRTQSKGTTETTKLTRFDEKRIIKLMVLAHQLATHHDKNWKTLLVMDDFDLIQRQSNGQLSPTFLLQTLKDLSAIQGFFVLTTVRQDTYTLKDFYRLVSLHPFDDPKYLHEIYQKHVEHWNDGNDPFQGSFVAQAAEDSKGRVGLFLQVLRDAWSAAGGSVTGTFSDWIKREWVRLERDEPAIASLLRKAAQKNGGILESDDADLLRESIAAPWILEDFTSSQAIRVNPLLNSYLQRLD